MPYLVKSKATVFRVRDGTSLDSPVYAIGGSEFVAFDSLPKGIDENLDPYFVVKKVEKLDPGTKKAEPVKKSEQVTVVRESNFSEAEEKKPVKHGKASKADVLGG